jgi:hypothetical protein
MTGMVRVAGLVLATILVVPLAYLAMASAFGWWLPFNTTEPLTIGSRFVTLEVSGGGSRFEGTVAADGEERFVEGDAPGLVRIGSKADHTIFGAEIRRSGGSGVLEIALLGCPDGNEPRQRLGLGSELHVIRCGGENPSTPQAGSGGLTNAGLCGLFSEKEIVAVLGEPALGGPSKSVPSGREHCGWMRTDETTLLAVIFPASQFAADLSSYGTDSNIEKLPDVGDEAVFITPKPHVPADAVRRSGAALLLIRNDDEYLFVFLNEPRGVEELRRLAPLVGDRLTAR